MYQKKNPNQDGASSRTDETVKQPQGRQVETGEIHKRYSRDQITDSLISPPTKPPAKPRE